VDELVDLKSKCRFDLLISAGLEVQAPEKGDLVRVREAAQKTGDLPVISATDCDVLALALGLGATVFTDDFAIQNVAGGFKNPGTAAPAAGGKAGCVEVPLQRMRAVLQDRRGMPGLRRNNQTKT